MELANAILNLAGDVNQQVQKWGITPAEAAVLRFIHGSDALNDIAVIGTVDRKDTAERERLVQEYGRGENGQVRSKAVEALFPGLGSRLPNSFEDLPDPVGHGDEEETVEVFTPIAAKPKSGGKTKAAKAEAPVSEPGTASEPVPGETKEIFS